MEVEAISPNKLDFLVFPKFIHLGFGWNETKQNKTAFHCNISFWSFSSAAAYFYFYFLEFAQENMRNKHEK